jgi:hypothetical protein
MKLYNPTIIGNTVSDGSFTGTEFLGINADTITTAVSITNATLTDAGYSQSGKVIKIDNGANAINYTVNARLTASFVKGGTGAITFVQGAGRTLIGVYGLVFDGAVGSTASISSFGTTDIVTISGNILNGEIRLPAYPSTRNDGVIPTNKVLSTDTNGNLKLYSIATAPAPFLDYVVPDSTLPSTTGNFQLHGSFFTPSMCLTANLATSIIFTGQTVNYAIFHSSNWIEVNITTGATEGSFAVTLNNGLSATFNNAIMIVLGTVFSPLTAEWTLTEPIDVDNDKVMVQTANSAGSAIWSKVFNVSIDIEVSMKIKATPLGAIYSNPFVTFMDLRNVSDNVSKFRWGVYYVSSTQAFWWGTQAISGEDTYQWQGSELVPANPNTYLINNTDLLKIRCIAGIVYVYLNGVLKKTVTGTLTENVYLKCNVRNFDIYDIKYIELAS